MSMHRLFLIGYNGIIMMLFKHYGIEPSFLPFVESNLVRLLSQDSNMATHEDHGEEPVFPHHALSRSTFSSSAQTKTVHLIQASPTAELPSSPQ